MAKIYIEKNFGAVPNELLNNKKISLKAKGLYAYLQSKYDGWEFSVKRMTYQLKEGKDAITRALKELERAGYLERKLKYDEKKKRIAGYDYILHAKPIVLETSQLVGQSTGLPLNISKKEYSKKDNRKKENIIGVSGKSDNIFLPGTGWLKR